MHDKYSSPLSSRYASKEMLALFSDNSRYQTFRRLWVALAESEMELGLKITKEQIDELKANIENIDFEAVARKEKEIRHDVMAHVYAYGLVCPKAKGIIHLGATSCYVTDNADIIIMKQGLELLRNKLQAAISALAQFARQYRALPTLGFTHFQPAQPTTVGKRACLWLQDFLSDLNDLEYVLGGMRLLGNKGTTGTQASFMELFDNDGQKVKLLEEKIARKMGFEKVFPVSGQTYPRKEDSRVLNVLSGIAQSAYRFAGDLRLLQNLREVEEPFEKSQVGSSAMAYKRNPMRSERICSLARYVISDALNPALTASTQWLERTLDDSANRRIAVAEAFLATDAILKIVINIAGGMVVYPKVIEKRLNENLPFIATENILMEGVRRGGDRQELHERIRVHSMEAARVIKEEGGNCDLISRIAGDSAFKMSEADIKGVMKAENYIGRAPQQVDEFLDDCVQPAIKDFSGLIGESELKV
ncbi:MAG: adenylosuccinate lyase [Christensenellaceae bacterium]|jgi:adenylosuccinate lyase|nr:adenylosuccinate lyase [Christensenellaceae bacterium]PWL99969.1 MAG: adenylosuccinate lyase [Selenomonadales bacterium]